MGKGVCQSVCLLGTLWGGSTAELREPHHEAVLAEGRSPLSSILGLGNQFHIYEFSDVCSCMGVGQRPT